MGLFAITKAGLEEREVAQFAALGLYERSDLQRTSERQHQGPRRGPTCHR
jgi:hypothetical protein